MSSLTGFYINWFLHKYINVESGCSFFVRVGIAGEDVIGTEVAGKREVRDKKTTTSIDRAPL